MTIRWYEFAGHFWHLMAELAPLLILGLLIAAVIKLWLPESWGKRWLGGTSFRAVTNAALIGTPLPLCSCSVMPVALSLYRQGISKGATVSFLIATPENGIPSLAMSYILLGPLMTIVRPIASIVTAIFAGLLTNQVTAQPVPTEPDNRPLGFELHVIDSDTTPPEPVVDAAESHDCCHAEQPSPTSRLPFLLNPVGKVFQEAFGRLFDDLAVWVLLGVIIAALMNCLFEPDSLAAIGKSPLAYVLMALIGVPIYVCATASTPLAASFLIAGVSPGAVLVFLLSGPATNFSTLGVLWKQIGRSATLCYLAGVTIGPIVCGLVFDVFLASMGLSLSINPQSSGHNHSVVAWWQTACVIVLGVTFAVRFCTPGADLLNWMRPWSTRSHLSSPNTH